MTGAEIWMAAAKALAGLVVKTGWDMGDKDIGTPIKQQIFKATRQYIQKYWKRHGTLKVLGMSKPVSLESVYTTVQLLDAKDLRSFESVETLEEAYRQSNSRSLRSKKQQRQAGINVANEERYLTVLGGPGIGKSTFLRKIGLEALKGKQGKFKHSAIPVFLELKRFDSDEIDIKQLTIDEFRTCGFPDPEVFTDKALKKGRLLVLLDGLDEVPTQNLTQVIRKIQDFVDQYDTNRFIASCRTAAYHGYFKRCADVAIAEFDGSQIKQFIHNWFHSELDQQAGTAANCWELLQRPENASALELAQTPLLLTFLCLVYDESQNLPDNRSTLYRKALDILLERWAAEKRIQREAIYQGLHTDLEKALLSEIAYKKFEADQLFFSKQEVINQITTFLAETLDAPKHLDGQAVLHAIEVQQGILVERAEGIYSFSHLTIQEFLTARYATNNQKCLEKLISTHLANSHWREVFLLVAGLKDSADDLLLEMEKQALTYISTLRLKALICRVGQIVGNNIKESYKLSAKRALIIGLALADAFDSLDSPLFFTVSPNTFDNPLALARQSASTLASALDSESVFYNLIPLTHDSASAHDSISALDLKEVRALTDYLTATLIMVKCKESAVRVSKEVWNGIEKRILTTPE
ncbi:MAG: NACHT domain-containing protein [Cyanobacteria bacterium P01_A01_bin.17]